MSHPPDVVFDADALVVQAALSRRRRRVSYRIVSGIERSGARLWIGTRWAPVVLGGSRISPERLGAVEAELRQRIAALPDGAERLRRIDARRAVPTQVPWLTPALSMLLALPFASSAGAGLGLAADLAWLVAFGLLAEHWLGRRRLLASGGAALVVAAFSGPPGSWLELGALAMRAFPSGWIGLLGFARLLREGALCVRLRSALDTALLLAFAFGVRVLTSGTSARALGLGVLTGFGVAALALRGWPPASAAQRRAQ